MAGPGGHSVHRDGPRLHHPGVSGGPAGLSACLGVSQSRDPAQPVPTDQTLPRTLTGHSPLPGPHPVLHNCGQPWSSPTSRVSKARGFSRSGGKEAPPAGGAADPLGARTAPRKGWLAAQPPTLLQGSGTRSLAGQRAEVMRAFLPTLRTSSSLAPRRDPSPLSLRTKGPSCWAVVAVAVGAGGLWPDPGVSGSGGQLGVSWPQTCPSRHNPGGQGDTSREDLHRPSLPS